MLHILFLILCAWQGSVKAGKAAIEGARHFLQCGRRQLSSQITCCRCLKLRVGNTRAPSDWAKESFHTKLSEKIGLRMLAMKTKARHTPVCVGFYKGSRCLSDRLAGENGLYSKRMQKRRPNKEIWRGSRPACGSYQCRWKETMDDLLSDLSRQFCILNG